MFHEPIEIVARVGDTYHTDRSTVPELRVIEFRDGNIETAAEAIFQAPDDLTAILDRLSGFDVNFEGEESDHRSLVAGRSSLANGSNRRTTNDRSYAITSAATRVV